MITGLNVPMNVPLDEIVIFTPGRPARGWPLGRQVVIPLMLSEAVIRALSNMAAGGQPSITIRGATYSDPDLFHAIRARPDFPKHL